MAEAAGENREIGKSTERRIRTKINSLVTWLAYGRGGPLGWLLSITARCERRDNRDDDGRPGERL